MVASFDLHPLTVLGAAEERLVIWHVNVGAALGESRLSGAWVLERSRVAEIESLTRGYPVVVTDDARVGGTAGIVDVDATVETVRAAIESADEKFDEHQAAGGKLIRPQWPVIVPPEEVSLTDSQVDVVDDYIRPVLTLARGLAELADAWAAFESLRLARAFLVELGGSVARPLPLAVR
ncbi:hypothetical protein GPX89_34185 [Nocardia sp. ET3-3]|uniref:Uncharacterized protein n=1 Tax=Nocardia terrae TaxID=2675851 RepID=A0A7K1V6K4_9NOCA|nr:hypothetical protein [Nocardia terrae]MVU82274.1 hypothetical protein [Nocardia terrae]